MALPELDPVDRLFGNSHANLSPKLKIIEGVPRPNITNKAAENVMLRVQRKEWVHGTAPPPDLEWVQIIKPGEAYTVEVRAPGIDGDQETEALRATKLVVLDRRTLPEFVPDGRQQYEELQRHVWGRCSVSKGGQKPTRHDGFLDIRSQLKDNRDGKGTAYTTSFTAANSSLVAPVAHSYNSDETCQRWLQRFNGLSGDFAGKPFDPHILLIFHRGSDS